ncbi:MAG: hypothetical protein N2484_11575 [Clostridia bacterium]|nr:hypothetical protein [Clostridia bacterium]
MDKMSLFSIMTVSVPEAVLNIYIAFVLTGQRSKLYLDDKLNVIRLLTSVVLMVVTAVTTRAFLPNLLFVLIANIIIIIFIFKLVYNLTWFHSSISVLVFFGVLITVESVYAFQFMALANKYFSNYSPDILRLITTIPERIIQIFLIISFWKWDLVYLNIRNNKKLLRSFVFFVLILLFNEAIFSYTFFNYFDTLSFIFKILGSVGCFAFGLINFLICNIVTNLYKDLNH